MMPQPKLDPRESHHLVPSHHPGLRLFLRHLGPERPAPSPRVVLYLHGATFPSALSIAHRFDGRSWRDSLVAAGFEVWGLDLHGFGGSDPQPELALPAEVGEAVGRADDAVRQVERAVAFIAARHGVGRVSLVAHSWGTMAAGRFAGCRPERVERLLLFGPIARRSGAAEAPRLPAWRLVTVEQQWQRFVQDTPAGQAPVLLRRHFEPWAERWLDSDPQSRARTPPAVRVPAGPAQDIAEAWAGRLAWDPGLVRAPTAILRGRWDSLSTAADARSLLEALSAVPQKRDLAIPDGGHLLHLEEGRHALHAAAEAFLLG
ncbi:Lysophospholipase, alpha-beta hydrolase superfamily [Tistlia consotensis]|uniref:Lysophospholipase, alpha-beta hydrolase superfamily n=1 Tax=Tistlia consotensis USBA 355 TaxID=560819 RepID=A0A1Y6CCV4_9PROT|nr:alpha/beta hydrolase [Tistlia consotensis]SMF48240.1 Lysophospholipase, alpha-beta hydrolase superfamily [Tistlia consotensis USBA 355]SNR81551.1 Lysophospholipase, alpha-beta hydrolase superfamily [Tistlia consotensis]